MKIWVDADSCPRPVRDIIQRAARRTGIEALFVANREIPRAKDDEMQLIRVERRAEAADRYILDHSDRNDLVVTRDLPLAKVLVERGNTVLNDRGDVFSSENVGERLSIRNFMYQLRRQGLAAQAGRSYGQRELQSFANAFDRELTRLLRGEY